MRDSRAWWTKAGNSSREGFRALLLLVLAFYRSTATNLLGGACRFEPSCSAYAVEAAKLHHPTTAIRLIARRVCACRPGGRYGFDPVPLPVVRPQEKTA